MGANIARWKQSESRVGMQGRRGLAEASCSRQDGQGLADLVSGCLKCTNPNELQPILSAFFAVKLFQTAFCVVRTKKKQAVAYLPVVKNAA